MRHLFLALGACSILLSVVPSGRAGPDKGAAAVELDGRWQLTLPAGFTYEAVIQGQGGKQFRVEKAVRFSGVYELRGKRLVLVKSFGKDAGFEWEARGPDELALVAQPPVARTGSNYLGATLKRLRADAPPPAPKEKAPRPAPKAGPQAKAPDAPGGGKEGADRAELLRRIRAEYRVRKEPAYRAPVQYCLLLLGRDARTRVWLASDGTTMYVDRNGNGDLTEPGEAFPFNKGGFAFLMTDDFPGHGGDGKYTGLHIAVRQRDWEKNAGGYWAVRADVGGHHEYGFVHKFAKRPEDAPAIHLGAPARMGLYSLDGGALVRGKEVRLDASVIVEYPGVEKAFVDSERRCPADVHPVAEILLPPKAAGAEPVRLRVPLKHRC